MELATESENNLNVLTPLTAILGDGTFIEDAELINGLRKFAENFKELAVQLTADF